MKQINIFFKKILTIVSKPEITKYCCLQGGIYVFQIVDYYAAAISLMFIAFFEIISVVWCYGTERLSANIKDMTGNYPNKIFRFCWVAISPLLILVSVYCYSYEPP